MVRHFFDLAESLAEQMWKDTFAALPRKDHTKKDGKGHINLSKAHGTDRVGQILDKGPKFAVHPHATTTQLLGMVHDVARRLSEKFKADGIDEGVRCAMQFS